MSENFDAAVTWDRPKLERLKRAYKQAQEQGHTQFTFDGVPVLVAYAKYLIEYLEDKLA